MSNEFIREVDEEYRRDQVARFWQRYSGLIVGLAVLIVVAVGGWRYWEYVERNRAEAAAARYQEALRLTREAKPEEAAGILESLGREAPDGYQLLARFRRAAALGRDNPEEGAQAYAALAAEPGLPALWRDFAILRGALLRLAAGDAEPASAAVQPVLEGLAGPENAWRHTAREMLGLIALRRGDYEAAGRWFDQVAADRETPQALRGRLEIYSALVAGGPVQVTQ